MDWQLIFISNCLWLFISRRGNVKDEMDIKQVDEEGDDDDGFFGPALPPGYQEGDKSPEG